MPKNQQRRIRRLERLLRDLRDVYFSRGNPEFLFLVPLCADLCMRAIWGKCKFLHMPYQLIDYLMEFRVEPGRRPGPDGLMHDGFRFEVLNNLFLRYVSEPARIVEVRTEAGVKP